MNFDKTFFTILLAHEDVVSQTIKLLGPVKKKQLSRCLANWYDDPEHVENPPFSSKIYEITRSNDYALEQFISDYLNYDKELANGHRLKNIVVVLQIGRMDRSDSVINISYGQKMDPITAMNYIRSQIEKFVAWWHYWLEEELRYFTKEISKSLHGKANAKSE